MTTCTRPGCDNPITPDPKAKRPRAYCSNACRQKAYRQRNQSNRNTKTVTVNTYDQVTAALDGFTHTQLESLRNRIDGLLGKTLPDLIYFRKGKGVTHIAVDRNVTFCGRDTAGMEVVGNDEGHKVCQRCQRTRDDKSWWRGWRDVFGDG